MKKYKSLFFVTLVSLFLLSCQSVQDGLTLKKKENTEQFLIEKKKPLIMPPDFDDLPQPGNLDLENEKAFSFSKSKLPGCGKSSKSGGMIKGFFFSIKNCSVFSFFFKVSPSCTL